MIGILNTLLLEALRNASLNNDLATLNSLGINEKDAALLRKIDIEEANFINQNHINVINVTVDIQALGVALQRTSSHSAYHKMLQEAVLLGATREIMKQYARISSKQFNEIRQQLGLTKNQRLSTSLSIEQEENLDAAIKSLMEPESIQITLNYLVSLAKQTNVPINMILMHIQEFWGHNHVL